MVSECAADLLKTRKKSIAWFCNLLELAENGCTIDVRSSEVSASEVKAVLCAWIKESDGNDREKLAGLLCTMNLRTCSYALKKDTGC